MDRNGIVSELEIRLFVQRECVCPQTGAYRQLEKECAALAATLHEAAAARRRDLATGLSDAARARVRLTAHDLRVCVCAALSHCVCVSVS